MRQSSTFEKKKTKEKKTPTPEDNEHFSGRYGYTTEEWAQKLEMDRLGNDMWNEGGCSVDSYSDHEE